MTMQHPAPDWPKTLDAFRSWHERQPEVWEFIEGMPVLMAPGSITHTQLKTRAGRQLSVALDGTPCEVFVDGALIEVANSSLIPDVVVTCQPIDRSTPVIAEPLIIVEVLSPSNEKDDLGKKLALYLQIPRLRHYLAIHQDRHAIVHHERREDLDGFLTTLISEGAVRLEPPGIEIDLAGLYEGIPTE